MKAHATVVMRSVLHWRRQGLTESTRPEYRFVPESGFALCLLSALSELDSSDGNSGCMWRKDDSSCTRDNGLFLEKEGSKQVVEVYLEYVLLFIIITGKEIEFCAS